MTPKLTIVTGASSNHFACLRNLLLSIQTHEPEARVIVYDLGLNAEEERQLRVEGARDVRRFRFDDYPDWMRIDSSRADYCHRAGCYGWKPVILWEIACQNPGLVLWTDAGNLVHAPLRKLREEVQQVGLYTPQSVHSIARWTHPGTLAYFRVRAGSPMLDKPNRNSAIIGVNTELPATFDLLRNFRNACLQKEVVAPEGANYYNHRFDQAVLTLLAYGWEESTKRRLCECYLDITVHHDGDDEATARKVIGI